MSIEGAPVPSTTAPVREPETAAESELDLARLERSVVSSALSSSLARVRRLATRHPTRTVEVVRGWLRDGRPG